MKQFSSRVGVSISLLVLLSGLFAPLASAESTTTATPTTTSATTPTTTGTTTPTSNPNGVFDVVVSPVTQDLEVDPGQSVSTTIQLRNQGIATEHVKVTVMKFGASGQDGTPQLENVKPSDDYIKWATFSETHFDAEPNVWTPITMTISTPSTAAFGYYYAVIFSRDAPQTTTNKTANLLGAVASLVLLNVNSPNAVRRANIAEFSTASNVIEFLPQTFTVRMHNTGNVHVAPRGNIFVSKGGKQLAILEVNLAEGNILPNSYRKFTAQWTDGTPSYKVVTANGKVVLDKQGNDTSKLSWSNFNMSKLRFGKYDAKLVMVYNDGSGDISTQAQLSFWIIPWRIIFVILIAVVLVCAGIWTLLIRPLRRRLHHKKAGTARRR